MKILQIIQKPQLRGAELFACQLSNHLLKAGHQVRMISLLPGVAKLPFQGELIQFNRPAVKRFTDIEGWKQLARYIREFQPDVVQANAGDTLKFAILSRLIFRWKSAVIFRNANRVSDFIDSVPKLLFNKFMIHRTNHVISVSELCRMDLIRTYRFHPDRTTTIPIGIEPAHQTTHTLPVDLHTYFRSAVLINVASLVPEKNHAGLLRIVKKLIGRYPDLKVLVLGDGKLRERIEEEIKRLSLSDHVFLLGYRNDVLAIMPHARGLLLPSLTEGLPGVILEAFASKVPVIAYDVGGISEVIDHHRTGWLIRKNDENDFANAITELLSNSQVGKITAEAFERVTKNFKNEELAKRFADVYRAVASE